MGFKVGRVFHLEGEFKGTDAEGAHVSVRSASIASIRELRECDVDREAELLAEHITGWDLEDDNGPVPVSVAGVLSLEEPLKNLLINEWMKATRGITAPFDRRSAGGDSSPTADETAPLIPMETL